MTLTPSAPSARSAPSERSGWTARQRRPAVVGAVIGALATAVVLTGLGRPALWADEATTVVLIRRSWVDLARVVFRVETPLGPYYLLMKPWLAISSQLWWLRLPSALAMVVAAVALAIWVTRRLGGATGLATGLALLAFPAFSRYAQEVRPYGLMTVATVACSITWWRWRQDGSASNARWYAFCVAMLPLTNLLALTLVPAQLAAMLLGRPAWPQARRLIKVAGLGLLPVAPFVLLAALHSRGVAHPVPLRWSTWWTTLAASIAAEPRTAAITQLVAAVVALSSVPALHGISARADPLRRAVLLYACCWVLVPLLMLTALAATGSSTLVPRYFLISLPGWAILVGESCAMPYRFAPKPSLKVAAAVSAMVPLLVFARLGLPRQMEIRADDGHGQGDPRAAVALLESSGYRGMPVVVVPRLMILNAAAADPRLFERMPLVRKPDKNGLILRGDLPTDQAQTILAPLPQLAVLVASGDPNQVRRTITQTAELAGFEITELHPSSGWSVVLLHRAGHLGG